MVVRVVCVRGISGDMCVCVRYKWWYVCVCVRYKGSMCVCEV